MTIESRVTALEQTAATAVPPAAIAVVVDWCGPDPMPAGNYADPNESTSAACKRLGIDPAHVTRVHVVDQSVPRP